MITNWAYLLLNNMAYWKLFLAASANAILITKLQNLNNLPWRQYFDEAHNMFVNL
jgi:hypothetical protein